MKIQFTGSYKSLSNFTSDDITDFCVITGKNGSGKSQLLKSMTLKKDRYHSNDIKHEISFLNSTVSIIQYQGLENMQRNNIGYESRQGKIDEIVHVFEQWNDETRDFLDTLFQNGFSSIEIRELKGILHYLPGNDIEKSLYVSSILNSHNFYVFVNSNNQTRTPFD